ncbi:hypothetical protein ABVV53_02865 [Novosphingobium sp. RD2P27]|uniref:RDD family protein n=1 Tax=Novosphingobium kalidii TaxID=3230299 RepID=A0ABV2CXU3_9SPHN
MTIGSLADPWPPAGEDGKAKLPSRKRLRVAAALFDAACLSVVLWLAILAILR